jgi:hypothetical protein
MSFNIPKDYAEIVPEGGAGNTISVVDRAIELRDHAHNSKSPYAHVWCVIDRDEFPVDRYRRAFDRARHQNGLTLIWANECFEIWYLLHFCYRDTGLTRFEIYRELEQEDRLNRKYEKADTTTFSRLEGRLQDALRNAEKLAQFNSSPHQNPSTNIHRLVRSLLDIQEAAQESQ